MKIFYNDLNFPGFFHKDPIDNKVTLVHVITYEDIKW